MYIHSRSMRTWSQPSPGEKKGGKISTLRQGFRFPLQRDRTRHGSCSSRTCHPRSLGILADVSKRAEGVNVHITCRRKVVKLRPVSSIPNLDRRPVDSVEVDIILAHELIKVHVVGVEPPLFPLRCQVGGDAWVSNGSIKLKVRLDIKLFAFSDSHSPKHL